MRVGQKMEALPLSATSIKLDFYRESAIIRAMGTSSGSTDIRIDIIMKEFERGMRGANLSGVTSPWFRAGIRALEDGVELTSSLLEEADKAQNMALPERR